MTLDPKHQWLRVCSWLAACALTTLSLAAQSPRPRIQAEVSSSYMSPLKGSLHPLAQAGFEAGRLPANTPLHGMSIVFNRTPAQQADLEALLAEQQNPASPLYHQWLTPEQFGARFGMAQEDLDKVQTWLEQQGFAVESVSNGRNLIRFSGNTGQVERAFQTEMHYYTAQGEKHFAPSTQLSVPEAIVGSVAGIRNLDDVRPRPMHVRARPAFTSNISGAVRFAPGDVRVAYDMNPLLGSSFNGTGQKIVIVGQSAVVLSDIENFQKAASLTVKDPAIVIVPNTGTSAVSNGDQGESDLDLEWSGAMATGATIEFIYVGNLPNFSVFDSIQYAVDQKIGTIISVSYGACEGEISTSNASSLEAIMQQATAQGQTVVAASGDSGSTTCFGLSNLPLTTQESLSVSYPASSQYVTGIGGTQIPTADDNTTTGYFQAASGSDVLISALKYIPEEAWNESLAAGGPDGSGGGASVLFGKPSYQASLTPADGHRDVPDVALYSSPDLPGYLFCTSDTSDWNTTQAPLQTGSCGSGFRASSSDSTLTYAGGTSFATPIFAGMLAVLNQKLGYTSGQGLINPTLYTLASDSTTYAAAFHDVTSGNNECPASLGPTICSSTSGAETSYSAGTGYDEVTGLGSVDLNALAGVWPASSSVTTIGTTTLITASTEAPALNATVTFPITVVSDTGSTIPTGTVSISVDGGTASTQTLASGTYTLSTSFTTTGSHTVTASYSGDSTHAASSGAAVTVNVATASTGTGSITLAATGVTVKAGSTGTSTVTVTPAGGYKGTVSFTVTTSSTSLNNACYSISNATVSGTAAVTGTLTFFTNSNSCTGAAVQGGTGKRMITPGTKYKVAYAAAPAKANPIREASFGLLAFLLAGFIGWRWRNLRPVASLVALAALGLALSACGGGGGSSGGGGGSGSNAPKGTYAMTVTGTDTITSTITATTSLTLTIN